MRQARVLLVAAVATAMVTIPVAEAVAKHPTATLIDVHELRPAIEHGKGGKGGKGGGGGKGGPKAPTTANCVNDDASAYANTVAPTGWLVGGPTTAHLNPATVPGSLGDVSDEMQAAFDAWLGGNVPAITVATDGTQTRYKATRTNDLMFGRTGGSIATTYTWRWSDGLIESDVVFNKGLAWFNAPSEGDGCFEADAAYDVRNIAAHEFGHVYGLDHPAGARYETMYAYGYTGETLKWSPTPGERSGLAALY